MNAEVKKLNPYARRNTIQARVDEEELREITKKAQSYFDGDISRLIRESLRAYKPAKRALTK